MPFFSQLVHTSVIFQFETAEAFMKFLAPPSSVLVMLFTIYHLVSGHGLIDRLVNYCLSTVKIVFLVSTLLRCFRGFRLKVIVFHMSKFHDEN